ncbi:MAG: 3-deoxy-D-manno-octulosonate 8-phosphate phosphatase [Bacteroidetes bacterium]|nr:3-deoxy-D-manno-octulosonate 8-phosphate phosphatase [Bacteroidota bacterium]
MNILELFKPIKTFVFDVDGVLAIDTMIVMPDGELVRSMNSKDGYAMQLAIKKGYHVVIISGGNSDAVKQRLLKLGVKEVFMGVHNKQEKLAAYAAEQQLSFDEMLYMGDDIPDYAAMQLAVLPCCPADAVPEIIGICKYISPYKGGYGCSRDVIEKVLKLNGHWAVDTSITST